MSGRRAGPVVLTPSFHGKDGVSSVARQVAFALEAIFPDRTLDVFTLTEERPTMSRSSGLSRFRSGRDSRSRSVAWAVAQARWGQRDRPVLVLHAHLAPLALPFVLRGAKLYQFIHGIEVWKPLPIAQRMAFRKARAVISVSRFSASRFQQENPSFDRAPLRVCHPGIGPSAMPAKADPSQPAVEDSPTALIVGRMAEAERYKGHDLLLSLWGGVLEEVPAARLAIVGGGDDSSRLEDKARSLGLGDRVLFCGTLSDDELAALYRRSSFLVMPSRNEGFGLVFLEAMRAAKPCIGAPGAAEEIIVEGETGHLVAPEDRDLLRRRIVELLRDRERCESMGMRGQARFHRLFTESHFRDRLEAVVREDL